MEGFVRGRALPLQQAFFGLPAGKETAGVPFWQLVGHLIVVKNVIKAFLDWKHRNMKLHVKCRYIGKMGHISKNSPSVLNMCSNVSLANLYINNTNTAQFILAFTGIFLVQELNFNAYALC